MNFEQSNFNNENVPDEENYEKARSEAEKRSIVLPFLFYSLYNEFNQ